MKEITRIIEVCGPKCRGGHEGQLCRYPIQKEFTWYDYSEELKPILQQFSGVRGVFPAQKKGTAIVDIDGVRLMTVVFSSTNADASDIRKQINKTIEAQIEKLEKAKI